MPSWHADLAHITISGTKITATGQYTHGIMASGSVSRGVMIYQSFSGDVQGTNGIYTQAGG